MFAAESLYTIGKQPRIIDVVRYRLRTVFVAVDRKDCRLSRQTVRSRSL